MKTEIAIFYADVHYPYHHKPSLNIMAQIGYELEVDYLINGGDAFNADGISKYTKKKIERGVYETGKEMDGFLKHVHAPLLEIVKPKKSYWCEGNHCVARVNKTLTEMEERGEEPELIEHYRDVLSFEKRFPETEVCDYNEYFQIGKMLFTHGTYHGVSHARQTAIAYGTNVMYGHLHSNQTFTHNTKNKEQPREATSVGCMCSLNPEYMQNKPNSWSNSFAIVTFLPSGQYAKEIVNVINGKAIFRGKVYYGSHKELSLFKANNN